LEEVNIVLLSYIYMLYYIFVSFVKNVYSEELG